MKDLSIGEVARYARIETSAIRYYESMGLLPPPKRVNGHRRYDASILKRLGLIQLVREAGFGIRDIQALFSDMEADAPVSTNWRALAAEKIVELDAVIKRTQAAKRWLQEALQQECSGVEECIAITFDESSNGIRVTLSCMKSNIHENSDARKSIKLMTMQAQSED